MAEVIGIASGIITLVAAVAGGIETAKRLYASSGELAELLDQVRGFSNLLDIVNSGDDESPSETVTMVLLRSRMTLDQLDRVISIKLMKNGSSRARRRSWARHKTKIIRLMNTLKEQRQELAALIGVNNLLTANKHGLALEAIQKQVEHADRYGPNLDDRLNAMHQTVLRTYDAVLSQEAQLELMTKSLYNGQTQLMSGCLTRGQHSMNLLEQGEKWSKASCSEVNIVADEARWSDERHIGSDKSLKDIFSECPGDLIESSPNFFPETYTIDQRIPVSCLMVVGSYEQESLSTSKTNHYDLLYKNAPRQWCKIALSITIPRTSMYWAAACTSPTNCSLSGKTTIPGGSALPRSMAAKMQTFLQSAEVHDGAGGLNLIVSHQDGAVEECKYPVAKSVSPMVASRARALMALAFVKDLGCRRYREEQVVQIGFLDPPHRFLSCVSGKLVYERMLSRVDPDDGDLYNVKVLHSLRSQPLFANLLGVVTDQSVSCIKSYLVEIPKSQCMISEKLQDRTITWERREKWARQLVEGVAQLHSRGFVAGNLLGNKGGPIIDEVTDCIQFWSFRSKLCFADRSWNYHCPPEICDLRREAYGAEQERPFDVTSKTDIFQLGHLLWLLAEHKPQTHTLAVCIRQRCTGPPGCAHGLGDTTTLPPLSEYTPEYYRSMVNICRAKDFMDRPTARWMLKQFPFCEDSSALQVHNSPAGSFQLDPSRFGTRHSPSCDTCGRTNIREFFFHCNICANSDFDICQECFAAGVHCENNTHLLAELREVNGRHLPEKYHSAVRREGVRDVLEV